jgi:hypothetical protein
MELLMRAVLRTLALAFVLAGPLAGLGVNPAAAQQQPPPNDGTYGPGELVNAGHQFFGTVSRGLAQIVEKAISNWGQPNGYVLGQEAGGAFVAGLRYGEGTLYTRNAGDLRVYWQGPSLGFDMGGSAYFVGGFGMTALTANNILVVPIRSGVGFRLGANVGYLKFTPAATWNPF